MIVLALSSNNFKQILDSKVHDFYFIDELFECLDIKYDSDNVFSILYYIYQIYYDYIYHDDANKKITIKTTYTKIYLLKKFYDEKLIILISNFYDNDEVLEELNKIQYIINNIYIEFTKKSSIKKKYLKNILVECKNKINVDEYYEICQNMDKTKFECLYNNNYKKQYKYEPSNIEINAMNHIIKIAKEQKKI